MKYTVSDSEKFVCVWHEDEDTKDEIESYRKRGYYIVQTSSGDLGLESAIRQIVLQRR